MSIPPVNPKTSNSSDEKKFYSPYLVALTQSPFKGLVKGITAGWTEVAVNQPLVCLTRIVQRRMSETQASSESLWKTLSIRQLYAGALANGTGMSFITGVQMWTIGWAKQRLAQGENPHTHSLWQNLSASSLGAMAASPFASWSELIMDRYRDAVKRYEKQGKQGPSPTYATTTRELWKAYRLRMCTLGLGCTTGRDIGFVVSYDSLTQHFKELFMRNKTFREQASRQNVMPVDLVATIAGSIFAGVIGITVTHPLDTRKTRIQAGIPALFWPQGIGAIVQESRKKASQDRRIFSATIYLFKNLMAEPYKGYRFRLARGVSAVTIFNVVGWQFERRLAQ